GGGPRECAKEADRPCRSHRRRRSRERGRAACAAPPHSYAHLRRDMGMGIVALDDEVLVAQRKEVTTLGRHAKTWTLSRLASALSLRLKQVVLVKVGIAERVDELAWPEVRHVRDHAREQGIARDVERHAQKDVTASLVELAAELPVLHVKLKERMAGGEGD